jgi:hypothetical protein
MPILFVLLVVLAAARPDLEQRVAAFNEWLLPKLPPKTNALRVFVHPELRIGAQATRDIGPEEVYNDTPFIISRSTALASSLRPLLDELERNTRRRMDFEVLLLFLVQERRLGAESAWAPYLDLLPESYAHVPVNFDDATLRELQVSAVLPAIRSLIASERHTFSELTARLGQLSAASAALLGAPLSQAEYTWAAGVLNSRRIWFNNEGHLIPLLDAVNCRSVGASRPHRTEPARSGDGCTTRSARAFKAGDEVFEDYGQPNHIYFRFHGFTLDENPHDCVLVPDPRRPSLQRCVKSAQQLAAWGMTRDDLANRLAAYATTIKQDQALLETTTDENLAGVIKFRLSEKTQLAALIAAHGSDEL